MPFEILLCWKEDHLQTSEYSLQVKYKGEGMTTMENVVSAIVFAYLFLLIILHLHIMLLYIKLLKHYVSHLSTKPSSCSALACYLALVPYVPDGSCALSIAFYA